MKNFYYFLAMILLSALVVTSCSEDDDDDNDTAMEYTLTQALFLSASNDIQTNINTGAMAHNGNDTLNGTDTFRDVYTNMTDVNGTAMPGDVITKFVYGKDANGDKGALQVAFAMVKQESEFGADHGNWYWYNIMPDANGELDFSTMAMVENQAMCSGCHMAGSSDYRYVFNN